MTTPVEHPVNTQSIRGPLRYEIETSSPQIEAGKQFSIFIRITNPYDVPATIKHITTKLPAKFQDVDAKHREQLRDEHLRTLQELAKKMLSERIPEIKESDKEKKERWRELVKSLLRTMPFGGLAVSGYEVAQYVSASNATAKPDVKEILKPENVEAIVQKVQTSDKPTDTIYQTIIEELKGQIRDLEEESQSEVMLQPGNSTVHAFTLRTTQTILFTPSSYNLNLQIEYEIDGQLNQDTAGYQLNVRSPLIALIAGAIIGAVIGYLVRDIFAQKMIIDLIQAPSAAKFVSWLVTLIGNVLIGALLVIAFARKKDTQPLLSIEDFWGGMFVGFLAGYMGKSILDQLLKSATPVNAP